MIKCAACTDREAETDVYVQEYTTEKSGFDEIGDVPLCKECRDRFRKGNEEGWLTLNY